MNDFKLEYLIRSLMTGGHQYTTDVQLKYAIRKLMCGSHQNDVDTQIYRASQIERKFNERRTMNTYRK